MPDVYFSALGMQSLQDLSILPLFRIAEAQLADESEIISETSDGLIATWNSPLSSDFLKRLPGLLTIALRATSTARVDLHYATGRGISVSNIHGYGDVGTAEFVIEQLLKLVREIQLRAKSLPHELFHKRLGLIGLGNVGSLVARSAEALGMEVCYFVPEPGRKGRRSNARFLPIEDLVSNADFLSFHTPAYTRALTDSQLQLIRPDTGLIVTTLGLPFSLNPFLEWAGGGRNRVIFDQCAAQGHVDALNQLDSVHIESLYSARTVESVARAEAMVISNLRLFLQGLGKAQPSIPHTPAAAERGRSWNS